MVKSVELVYAVTVISFEHYGQFQIGEFQMARVLE